MDPPPPPPSPRPRPRDVGILALHFHAPPYAVRQEDLERAHGVPTGKYTKGLGQRELGFGPAGAEDAASRALSAADALLTRHGVPARAIARVDVGTETSPDRSKSIASVLVGWLQRRARAEAEVEARAETTARAEGSRARREGLVGDAAARAAGEAAYEASERAAGAANNVRERSAPWCWDSYFYEGCECRWSRIPLAPVEAVDHTHACYGGAAALFASAAWVESSAWDGRSLALVVATDGAAYPETSPARATGGGGAAAMLVGPEAPLALEGWPCGRATASAHAFDFYKPHGRGGGGGGGGSGVRGEENGGNGNGGDDDDPSCPRSSSHHPVVDGAATTEWFLAAAEAAGRQWHEQQRRSAEAGVGGNGGGGGNGAGPSSSSSSPPRIVAPPPPEPLLGPPTAAFVCHAPFARMVRKTLGRLAMVDAGARERWDRDPRWRPSAEVALRDAGRPPGPPSVVALDLSSPEVGGASMMPTPAEAPVPIQACPPGSLSPSQIEALKEGVNREAFDRRTELMPWAVAGGPAAAAAVAAAAARGVPTGAPPPSRKALDDALAAALEASGELERLAADGMSGQTRVGNAYTASVFLGLAALLERRGGGGGGGGAGAGGGEGGPSASSSSSQPPLLPGQRILLFAFGSGVVATLFTLRVREVVPAAGGATPPPPLPLPLSLPASVAALGASQSLERRLSARPLLPPGAFDAAAAADEEAARRAPYVPPSVRARSVVVAAAEGEGEEEEGKAAAAAAAASAAAAAASAGGSVADLPEGSWYLARVDDRYRRVYARRGAGPVQEDEVLEGATLFWPVRM